MRTEGNEIETNLLQFWNACCPMVRTETGIVMDSKLLQPWNAESPIAVTFEGSSKVNPTKVVLFANALSPMPVTFTPPIVLGISTWVAVPVYPVIVPLLKVNSCA